MTRPPTPNASALRGAVPWDGLIETLDRIAAPPITPANDTEDAPIDTQLDGRDRPDRAATAN